MPAICFYSIDVKDACRHFKVAGKSEKCVFVDLREYYKAMGIKPEEYSILVIKAPWLLDEDLRREIPKAVGEATNIDNLLRGTLLFAQRCTKTTR